MPTIGTCALCLTEHIELKVSHILPNFVGKYLREQSVLKLFQHGTNPDKFEQDIEKMPLLCVKCEGMLSAKGETPFAASFFHPFQHNQRQLHVLNYEEWLLYFAISLSWRVVVTTIEEFRQDYPDLARWADVALEYWRNYLLGTNPDPGPYTHHIFFSGTLPTYDVDIPDGFNAYAALDLDFSIAPVEQSIFVYTKLPAIAFWSAIHPFEDEGWSNTQISKRRTLYAPQTTSLNFADFMRYRSKSDQD